MITVYVDYILHAESILFMVTFTSTYYVFWLQLYYQAMHVHKYLYEYMDGMLKMLVGSTEAVCIIFMECKSAWETIELYNWFSTVRLERCHSVIFIWIKTLRCFGCIRWERLRVRFLQRFQAMHGILCMNHNCIILTVIILAAVCLYFISGCMYIGESIYVCRHK